MSYKKITGVIGLTATLVLTGCSTYLLDNRNPVDPSSPEGPGTPGEARPTQSTYVTPIKIKDANGKVTLQDVEHRVLTLYGEFLASQGGYSAAGSNTAKIEADVPNFLKSGIALSDLACRDWFVHHDTLATRTNYSEGIFDILNAVTLTSLGLASVSSTAMGAVALLFGGIDSGYANFSANFLLTDSLGKLEKKLIVVREQSARNLVANQLTANYSLSRARAELIKYHDSCSHRQVVQYIKDSVDLAEFSFDGSNLNFDTLVKKASLPSDLYEEMYTGTGTFNEQTLKELFFVQYGNQQSPTIKKLKETPIIAQITAKYKELKDAGKEKAFNRKLNEFALLNNLRAELEQLMASEAEVVAADARVKAADALIKKIDGNLALSIQRVNAATVADATQLAELKKVGSNASAVLNNLKTITNSAPDKSEKVLAANEIGQAEAALSALINVAGPGAATKVLANTAFKEVKEAVDAVSKLVPLSAVSTVSVSMLEKADASAAQMKIDSDGLAVAAIAAPLAAAQAQIQDAVGALTQAKTDMAKANAAASVSVLGVGRSTLPTTFKVSPIRTQ